MSVSLYMVVIFLLWASLLASLINSFYLSLVCCEELKKESASHVRQNKQETVEFLPVTAAVTGLLTKAQHL